MGQQFSFKVEIRDFNESEILYLKRYQGFREITIDSVMGSGVKTLHVNSPNDVDGLYFLTVSESNLAEFILSEEEDDVSISIDKEKIKQGELTIVNSPENEAYALFVQSYLNYEQQFYRVASARYDDFSPKLISELGSQTATLESIQLAFNNELSRLAARYPNTFVARVLCPLVSIPVRSEEQRIAFETYHSFLFRNFWSNADLLNSSLLNHFMLNELLKNYFRFFVPKQEEKIKEAIGLLNQLSKENELVNNHIKSFLLRNFLNANANALSSYVNQLGDEGSCSLDLSEEQLTKLSALKTVLDSGSFVPEIQLPDRDQNIISLPDIYENSNVTVVLFWSANCSHCLSEMPFLENMHHKMKPSGIEVYAINLDENKFDFRDYLDEHPNDWINVTDVGPVRESEVVQMFNVQKTPTIFIIDKAGYVLSKNLFGEKLEHFLADYLDAK